MAINENTFFQYKETRATSGYKSAWLYKLPSEEKYHLICATESVPYVFGDKESFEINILQSPVIGKVEGKQTLDAVDVEVLHHRDNAYRFEKLKGETIDFMSINSEYVGYRFAGTVDYKPNNSEAEVNRATVTITPMSAEATPVFNARDIIEDTVAFVNAIPETTKIGTAIDFTTQASSVTYTIKKRTVNVSTYKEEETDATASATTDGNKITFSASGLYIITASASGYASWTTTVYVEE